MLSSHLKELVRYFLLVINSNLGLISHRFTYGQFFAKNAHFSYTTLHSTPNLKMFPLHCIPQILYAETESRHRANYLCKKFSLMPYGPTALPQNVCYCVTYIQKDDRQTDRQTTTVP